MSISESPAPSRGLRWLAILCLVVLVGVAVKVGLQLSSKPDIEKFYQQGLAAFHARDMSSAQTAAEVVAEIPGAPPYAAVLQGTIDLHHGRLRDAAAKFALAGDAPETAAIANALAGEVLFRNRQFNDAIVALRAAIEMDDSLTDAHRRLAAVYYDIGATGPAVKELETIAEQAPEDPRPRILLGSIFKDMEDWERASKEYGEALKLSLTAGERQDSLMALAACLVNAGRTAELEETLKDCPRTAETIMMLAQARQSDGDDEAASKLVEEALALAPEDLEALLLKGSLLLSAGDAPGAAEVLQRAAELHPLDFRIRHALSRANAIQGKTDIAQQQTEESSRLRELRVRFTELHAQAANDTSNAQLRYELGQVSLQLNRRDLAQSWFAAALALDPNHEGARIATGLTPAPSKSPAANQSPQEEKDDDKNAPPAAADRPTVGDVP